MEDIQSRPRGVMCNVSRLEFIAGLC